MKFSEKMCFKITLKVAKNQGFTLSLEDTFFKKPQGGGEGGGGQIDAPSPPAVLGLKVLKKEIRYTKIFNIYKKIIYIKTKHSNKT